MQVRPVTSERDGALAFLDQQRRAVRNACYGLSDEQARLTPTASTLSLGGLVKHLCHSERGWTARLDTRALATDADQGLAMADYMGSFRLDDDETLHGVLAEYDAVSKETDRAIGGIEDLGRHVRLPPAPWHPDPERCTVRWVLFHLIEETARHAGHADIIREALDGALSGPLMAAVEDWPAEGWIKPWRPER